ncbi:hypothetical protein G6F43_008747 [Rhizopus delemar]|nr:hypothetical protein G6F43_008747 [Rhizopus delemar]
MAAGTPTQSIAELITEFNKTTGDVPPTLIGASSVLVNNHVYVFGGRLQSNRQISNRLYILSLNTMTWKLSISQNTPPIPRYFHSANAQNDTHIVIYGGMTVKQYQNKRTSSADELVTLDDLVLLDLRTLTWEYPDFHNQSLPSPRYAHISTLVNDRLVIMGGQDINNNYLSDINIFDCKKRIWCKSLSSQQYQYGAYRSATVGVTPIQLTPPFAPNMDSLADPFDDSNTTNKDKDITIHVYSNHSASDAPRQLHSWKLNTGNECVDILNQTEQIGANNTAPPPIRFPSAFICGQQFILAGPYISGSSHSFQIWALDMTSFVWTKIEPGPGLTRGSWLRGMLCESMNKFLIFGHPGRTMKDDYKNRVHCFEYVALVDTEVFGIYRPPQPSFSTVGQSLGLSILKDPILADLKVVTTDDKHALVNSAVLAQRWPLIRSLLNPLTSPQSKMSEILEHDKRELLFPDTYIVLIAFLQFIYTDHLVTAQQHQPQILSRLLFIADLFQITRLKELATHALHQMLNMSTAAMIYESASLSNAVSLQIRALRVLINAKKMMQRQQKLGQTVERPLSPPPVFGQSPLVRSNQIAIGSQSEPLNHYTTSKLLQKQDTTVPSTPTSLASMAQGATRLQNNNSVPFSTSQSATTFAHQRSGSDRSITLDYNPSIPGAAPPTPVSAKSMKFPSFLIRQQSSPQPQQQRSLYIEKDYASVPSPQLSPTFQEKHQPSTETLIKNSNSSKTHFWRHNTISTKKKTKSEGRTFGFSLK